MKQEHPTKPSCQAEGKNLFAQSRTCDCRHGRGRLKAPSGTAAVCLVQGAPESCRVRSEQQQRGAAWAAWHQVGQCPPASPLFWKLRPCLCFSKKAWGSSQNALWGATSLIPEGERLQPSCRTSPGSRPWGIGMPGKDNRRGKPIYSRAAGGGTGGEGQACSALLCKPPGAADLSRGDIFLTGLTRGRKGQGVGVPHGFFISLPGGGCGSVPGWCTSAASHAPLASPAAPSGEPHRCCRHRALAVPGHSKAALGGSPG